MTRMNWNRIPQVQQPPKAGPPQQYATLSKAYGPMARALNDDRPRYIANDMDHDPAQRIAALNEISRRGMKFRPEPFTRKTDLPPEGLPWEDPPTP